MKNCVKDWPGDKEMNAGEYREAMEKLGMIEQKAYMDGDRKCQWYIFRDKDGKEYKLNVTAHEFVEAVKARALYQVIYNRLVQLLESKDDDDGDHMTEVEVAVRTESGQYTKLKTIGIIYKTYFSITERIDFIGQQSMKNRTGLWMVSHMNTGLYIADNIESIDKCKEIIDKIILFPGDWGFTDLDDHDKPPLPIKTIKEVIQLRKRYRTNKMYSAINLYKHGNC